MRAIAHKAGLRLATAAMWVAGTVAAAFLLWAVFSAAVGPIGFRTALVLAAVYAVIQAGVVLQKRIGRPDRNVRPT